MRHGELSTQRHEIEVDGHRISVLTAGIPGDRPPVLAVHGFGSSAVGTWQVTGHLTAQVRAGRFVIAPDLLGHGRSDTPTDPAVYTLGGLVRIVEAGIAAFGEPAGPVDLLGYSLGARIGWELLTARDGAADGDPTAAGRPRRAVLGGFDGRALFDGVDEPLLRHALAPAGADDPAIDDEGELPADTRRIVQIIRAGRDTDPAALLALVGGLAGAPVAPGRPGQPILFASGERDALAAGAQHLAASLPNADYLQIPRRDHISAVPAGVFRSAAVAFLGD
ncbi:alpha/beta fold hydrolase [Nakamurella lactea]|uniref:alpha/beta fold hydrolase n=1 Tax=Nakamurella lactea TaxID=459515 RepID=UPI00040696A5|nr:alpha/beta fold hydrolase [Nakamurella lactea]